jgi:FkbM family methyltransferase
MNIKTLWVNIVSKVIEVNENILFYPKLRRCYKTLLNGQDGLSLVFDIGANRGQSIKFFRTLESNVSIVSFEASPSTFRKLENSSIARKSHGGLTLENVGVSDKSGVMQFHQCLLDETSSFDLPDINSKYLHKKARILGKLPEELFTSYIVNVTSLDDYLKKNPIDCVIDVLKVDVEGHELNVLKGAKELLAESRVRFIQVEEHGNDMRSDERELVHKFLADVRYTKVFELKHGFGDFKEVIFASSRYRDH